MQSLRQILIYRSALSPFSPLYDKRFGQSPYTLFFCVQFIIVPTNWIFANVFCNFLIISSSPDNVIVKSSLPYVCAAFFVAKSFECRYKMRNGCGLPCRGRRPRRPALPNKQYKMNMVWHNNVLIYGYVFIKTIHLFYVFIRNHSV